MKTILHFLITALVLSSSLACSLDKRDPSPTTAQLRPFKVAFNTWLGYSPLVMAKEKGYLEAAGLDVEITFLEGIGEKNSALLRGDIDAVGHTADSAVTSAAAGVDGQIIHVFDRSYGADGILAKSDIRTVRDLKGHSVALEPGFTGHFFFLYLLREAGLTTEDVNVISMDTGSAGSAFIAGSVDAAVTWEPWIGKTKERPASHILVTTADKPGLIVDVLFMNRSTIRERRDDVDALIAAMSKATDWYKAHPQEGNEIMAKFWKLPITEVEGTVAGMQFLTRAENRTFFGTSEDPGSLYETVRSAADLWLDAGVIDHPLKDAGSLLYHCESCR